MEYVHLFYFIREHL